jgi:hypothetical protein
MRLLHALRTSGPTSIAGVPLVRAHGYAFLPSMPTVDLLEEELQASEPGTYTS